MADLALQLLGEYRGHLGDGRALSLPTKKGWALLSYLALHPDQPIRRERLSALLWSERFEEQARGSLRQTLYEMRSALGEGAAGHVIASRTSVRLSGTGVRVDALRFESLARSGELEDLAQAEALYRGPLLDGLEIGEPVFAEWLEEARAHYRALACGTFEQLAVLKADRGDYDGGLESARRLTAVDALSEPAHRCLMRTLAAAGRRSEALEHYRALEALLHAELGVGPDAETQRLRRELSAATTAEVPALRHASQQSVAVPEGQVEAARARYRPGARLGAAAAVVLLAVGVGLVAWRPWATGVEPASVQDMAFPLPDKPSIAVLPFESLSTRPEDRFIAEGLTEDLVTGLSRLPQLFVTARRASAAFDDKTAAPAEVSEQLGVRYVLDGSVQRSRDTLRIRAQLVDAVAGRHLWADTFDGAAEDLFDMQDEIVRRILVDLQVELTAGDHARAASRGTDSLKAWLLRQQAVAELYKFTPESTTRTRELLLRAHEADPSWGRPLAGLAWTYWWEARKGWTDDREEWVRKGVELAQRAIEMNPDDTLGYMQLGNLHQLQGDHGRAIELRETAVEIAPNDFQANWGLGAVLMRAGQAERAVEVLKRARRLSPRHPASLTWTLAHAQLLAGRYEEAVGTASRAKARVPDRTLPRVQMTAAYSALGRMEDAQIAAQELLAIDPGFTVSGWMRQQMDYDDRAGLATVAELLVRAGLPE